MPDRQALIVVNRRGRRGRSDLSRGIHRLEEAGIDVFVTYCRDPERVPEVIQRFAPAADLIVIGGGDGTVSSALPAVLASGRPLGLLPMGNANDFARTLGIPFGIEQACAVIADGYLRSIDLGCVNSRPFLNVASIGVSVEVARRLTPQAKRRWGVLAYLAVAWEALHRQQSFTARIECGGQSHERRCIQVAVGNGRFYGGGMTIVDDAAIDDGRLDLYALPRVPWWRLLVLLPVLRWGRHRPVPDILSLHGPELTIATVPTMLPINVDGEVAAETPARFRVLRAALQVFAPRRSPSASR